MTINSTESLHNNLAGQVMGAGPYLARVVNHLDSTLMGGLEVLLYEGGTADSNLQSNTIPVYYMSPFWGTTSVAFEGNNSANFQDVQKSYGMWMIPPDIGSCVMVIFVRGMANAGYWIGCVPDTYQNHMVPGIAASRNVALTTEQERKYGTTYLPVGEFLKRSRDLSGADVDKFTKPVHPFADRLLAQGLILDDIRGVTSSSARREYPSSVFGISTPGPIDESQGAKTGQIGFDVKSTAYVSRLGGSQFVMDDGDKQGLNELIRIRTRTGHQILLHNSSDLIYIANAAGTAWIELTSQGKIDAYAADSISLHTEGDFNLRADRDFNIEAGRDLKMVANGEVHLESDMNFYIGVRNDFKLETSQDLHILGGTDLYVGANSDMHISAETDNIYMTAGANVNIKSAGNMLLGSTKDMNINGGTLVNLGSAGSLSFNANANISIAATNTVNVLGSQSLNLTSPDLNINSTVATAGPKPGVPSPATMPTTADKLPRYNLPNREAGSWSDGAQYKAPDIVSIMTRVPTHEPWDQHENVNPVRFSSNGTDALNTGTNTFPNAKIIYNKPPAGDPPKKTGVLEDDNVAAFLWLIRACEGTTSIKGYDCINGPNPKTGVFPWYVDSTSATIDGKSGPVVNKMQGYADHPRYVNKYAAVPQGSSAAGAYQFLTTTWDGCVKALQSDPKFEGKKFTPGNQDRAAILLLQQLGAYGYVRSGQLQKAIDKCGSCWTSMPATRIKQGNGPRTYQFCAQVFQSAGGTISS